MMKKIFLLAAGLLAGIYLHGQIDSTGFVFRLAGNYNESPTTNGLQNVIGYNAKTINGSASISAGYLYNRLLFSIGFECNHSKTEASGRFETDTQSTVFLVEEMGNTSLNTYGGILSMNYFLPVWHNLYFTPGFYLGYGIIRGNNSGLVGYRSSSDTSNNSEVSVGEPDSSFNTGYDNKISSNYFYLRLSPEFTWFFCKHFGLNIQTGGLGINVVDSDWRTGSKQINFNPVFWKLGILFKL